jgi:transposase-like protein
MAEKRTRRRSTAEFEADAAKRLLEGGREMAEVATEPGLSAGERRDGIIPMESRRRP